MSMPAPPVTAEAIAAAIAHAERRLWLLDMMTRFCMALLETLKPSGDITLVLVKAFYAISRGVRLCHRLEAETDRLLADLKAGVLPAPKAARAAADTLNMEDREDLEEREDLEDREDLEEREDLEDRENLKDREPREPRETESDKGFRARLEALEALLDQEAHAGGAGRTSRETAHILCRVLSLNPEWIGWLGEGWLADNLSLTPPAGESTGPGVARSARPRINPAAEGGDPPPAPLHTPPPPLQGPPRHPPTVTADRRCRLSKRRRRRDRGRARPARLADERRRHET